LGIPTLKIWAKRDSPEKFKELNKESLFAMMDELVLNNKSASDNKMAKTVKVYCGDIIVCSN
jgi:hypothetical protein